MFPHILIVQHWYHEVVLHGPMRSHNDPFGKTIIGKLTSFSATNYAGAKFMNHLVLNIKKSVLFRRSAHQMVSAGK